MLGCPLGRPLSRGHVFPSSQQRRRRRIQKQNRGRMPPERRRRTRFHDGPFQRRPHRRALVLAIDEHQRPRHPQEERHRQRERAPRHILQPRERSIVYLLHAADIVEFHRPHIPRIAEIAHRRVDERQVPVLADSHDDQARFRPPQQPGVALALGFRVRRLAVQLVKRRHRHVVEQPLPQKAPERRRMIPAHPRVLVHVKRGDARPVDFLRAQRRQERVLRHGGREDHRRPPRAPDLFPHNPRRGLRPRRAGLVPVAKNPHFEPVTKKHPLVCAHENTIAPGWHPVMTPAASQRMTTMWLAGGPRGYPACPWSFYILLVTFMGISPGGARESSPWREPWEQTRTARSPGGAKEPFHGDSPIAGHEGPSYAPTGLARLWAGSTGLTPWAIF